MRYVWKILFIIFLGIDIALFFITCFGFYVTIMMFDIQNLLISILWLIITFIWTYLLVLIKQKL
jgi:hypothetical protein